MADVYLPLPITLHPQVGGGGQQRRPIDSTEETLTPYFNLEVDS